MFGAQKCQSAWTLKDQEGTIYTEKNGILEHVERANQKTSIIRQNIILCENAYIQIYCHAKETVIINGQQKNCYGLLSFEGRHKVQAFGTNCSSFHDTNCHFKLDNVIKDDALISILDKNDRLRNISKTLNTDLQGDISR